MNATGDSQPLPELGKRLFCGLARVMPAVALLLALTASAAPVKSGAVEWKSAALNYRNSWSREASAIPALDRELRIEATMSLERARRDAAEDLRSAREDKRPFHQHKFALVWRTVGHNARFLALQGTTHTYLGGAHPMTSYRTILWDRPANRPVHLDDLFGQSAAFETLTRPTYCKALDAERLKRRNGQQMSGEFDRCPKFADLAIGPVDTDKDGRFDAIDYVARPYVAGPYVEGSYSVSLPMTGRLIAAMKPQYRSWFEAQRQ